MKFMNDEGSRFDVDAFRHACRLWTLTLELSVVMAQFPSKEIAELSWRYRTLGLGYANLGTVLMVMGIPYDSKEATHIAGSIAAIMSATAYATSAEIAAHIAPFAGFEDNQESVLRVIRNHRRAAYDASARDYEKLNTVPVGLNRVLPEYLLSAARADWDRALSWLSNRVFEMRRLRSLRRPVPLVLSWIVTPPESNLILHWLSLKSSQVVVTSRSLINLFRSPWEISGILPSKLTTS